MRAGRILGIQDVTGKQANVASQSRSVVQPPPHPTLEAQGSQSEPVQVTSFTGNRPESAGPGSHGKEQPLPHLPYYTLA